MTAAKIMLGLDIVPRLCGAVMLTVGWVLSGFVGIEYPGWQMVVVIALAPVWLALELMLHFRHDTPLGKGLARFDSPFKWAIVIGCIALAGWSFADGRFVEAPWVGYKILIFAAIVFCSLMINRTIGPYIVGIQRIAEGRIDAGETAAMAASLAKSKWAVIGIWIGLVIEAMLGIVQPG
jgi:hypothetical protein